MNIHILTQADDGKTCSAIFHIPVPSIDNSAGIPYQTALVQYLTQTQGSISSQIATGDELAAIQAGAVLENPVTVRWSRLGLNNAQKLAELSAYYTAHKTELLNSLSNLLAFWGYSTDVL